jgi:membrane-associated phospholipid phosphatase
MKAIEGIARFFSALFSPLLMGTYGIAIAMWLSYLCYSPTKAKAIVIATTFVATAIIPIITIYLFNRMGTIKDASLNDRNDRTIPYIVTTFCYLGIGIYYRFVGAPVWLSLFTFGGACALVILTVVNRFWKISGHATGMGALVAMIFFLMCSGNSAVNSHPAFVVAVMLAGIVGSSRLLLGRHNLLQVVAGFANGFICIFLLSMLCQEAPLPNL